MNFTIQQLKPFINKTKIFQELEKSARKTIKNLKLKKLQNIKNALQKH